jgi:glyoxylase-like metal-dependent hydrolase (beta-lactamase superfamily II)
MTVDSAPQIRTIRLGNWEVGGFLERRFALDGGTMFGVVPRLMWEKLLAPDAENRVPMQTNLFLVKTGAANILLDTGLGEALSKFDIRVYDPRGPSHLDESLRLLGVKPEEITHVVFTHLHTDHSNGAFVGDADKPHLRFPNAKHYVQRDEWDDATHPDDRTSAVYVKHRLEVLAESGRLELIDTAVAEVVPGVRVARTGGHTRGHQGVRVEHDGRRFLYYADIIPSRFHLKGPYVAAVDLFPLDTMRAKKALLAEAVDDRTVIGFDHDIEFIFGRLVQKEKWIDVAPVEAAVVSA